MIQWSNEADIDNKWSSDLIMIILITNEWSNEVDIDSDQMKLILITNDPVI